MMKTYLLLLSSLPATLFGQSYYYVYDQGVANEFNPLLNQGTVILSDPADDVFSPNQTIPFTWSFFGSNVSQYKVSDNGYLTFNLGPGSSTGTNAALPTSPTPPNAWAIFALWDNLELSSNPSFVTNTIRTYTVGTAPNRVHVIQWHATEKGKLANSGGVRFAVRLFEQGDFDVVLHYKGPQANLSATIGCEDFLVTDATMVAGSPSFTFTTVSEQEYDPSNVTVYKFIYGSQPTLDASINRLFVTDVANTGTSYDIGGRVINHGTQTITSLKIDYQVNGGPVQSAVLSGLNIDPNETYDFTHTTPWVPTNPGSFQDVTVRIAEVNAAPDENPLNDEQTQSVWVNLGTTAAKKVLIEQFATSRCGDCPDGYHVLSLLLDSIQDVVSLTHHAGAQSDAMTIPVSVAIADELTDQGGKAAIDRVLWPDESTVALSNSKWMDAVMDALETPGSVGISINPTWNAATREIGVTVSLDFVDYIIPGDLRLNVFVIEDKVTGSGQGYDQRNNFDNLLGHYYYQAGNPIIGFVHRKVMRESLTGTWGDATGIPQDPGPNDDLQVTGLTYTLPAGYKQQDVSIVAFLSYGDSLNRRVINAAEVDLGAPATGVDDFDLATLKVFPNPMTTDCTIALPTADFTVVKLYDMAGNLVHAIPPVSNEVHFSREALAGGLYLIEAVSEHQVLRTRLVVQ